MKHPAAHRGANRAGNSGANRRGNPNMNRCRAGPGDVLAALGLSLADLFEHDGPTAPHHRPEYRRIPPGDILQALALEAAVAALATDQLARGRELNGPDRERLFVAARRLSDGAELAGRYRRVRHARFA